VALPCPDWYMAGAGRSRGERGGVMQDPVCELPRINIPRTSVNRGKQKGRSQDAPALYRPPSTPGLVIHCAALWMKVAMGLAFTSVYTLGYTSGAHPGPKLTIPIWVSLPPTALAMNSGPPLSP
jgi:hypothetical protein